MAKKKIEIEEVKEEKNCCGNCEGNACDCNEEKKGKKIVLSTLLTALIGAVTAGAMYLMSKKESPAPVSDVFRAPAQPVIPHAEPVEVVDVEVVEEVVEEAPVVEEAAAEEVPAAEAAPVEDGPKGPMNFVGNATTKVFHTLECGLGSRIEDDQKVAIGSVEEAFAYDYKPCGRCKPNGTGDYVCNTESKVFHKADCFLAKDRMLDEKKLFVGTREDAVARGYDPCGRCKP